MRARQPGHRGDLLVLIATGATLGTRHEEVTTAEQAAQALAPIAGRYASDVFGAGLLVSALVALPVLMATTGNVIAVQLRAPVALPARPRRAPVFTAAIVIATGLVLAMVVGLQIPPVRLLVIASVIAGVATPIGLIAMMLVSQDRRIMHARTIGGRLRAAGWAVTLVITLFSGLALAQQLTG